MIDFLAHPLILFPAALLAGFCIVLLVFIVWAIWGPK